MKSMVCKKSKMMKLSAIIFFNYKNLSCFSVFLKYYIFLAKIETSKHSNFYIYFSKEMSVKIKVKGRGGSRGGGGGGGGGEFLV